jgi:hypothetical protein
MLKLFVAEDMFRKVSTDSDDVLRRTTVRRLGSSHKAEFAKPCVDEGSFTWVRDWQLGITRKESNMQVTPLELGLAVAAIFIAFGPKRLPSFKKKSPAIEMARRNLAPSQYAAGRAPSPLQVARAQRANGPAHQFAMADASQPTLQWRPAPLPHELY